MVAARFVVGGDGTIAEAAIAVGACSAVATRLGGLEQALAGRPADTPLAETVEAYDFPELSPIDDVRGTGDYRRDAARVLVARASAIALTSAGSRVEEEVAA